MILSRGYDSLILKIILIMLIFIIRKLLIRTIQQKILLRKFLVM